MNPIELRALIASEQLAALQIQDGTMCAPSDAPLYDDERQVKRAISLADMLLAKLDQSTPSPARPALPWLDATDPNNDPNDGDKAWVAVKGRKGWTVAFSLWDEGGSAWFLEDDDRYLFGFINHRDVECYHCPADSFESFSDAVASLPK